MMKRLVVAAVASVVAVLPLSISAADAAPHSYKNTKVVVKAIDWE